jgi:hypothetical protein
VAATINFIIIFFDLLGNFLLTKVIISIGISFVNHYFEIFLKIVYLPGLVKKK